MSEEEKIAFNYYKGCNEKDLINFEFLGDISKKQVKYMELLLNLIEKQQKEIEKKDNTIASKDKEIKFLEELYDKHIKIINEMAENIYENDSIFYLPKEINSKETVIAYFTNLVQEGDK